DLQHPSGPCEPGASLPFHPPTPAPRPAGAPLGSLRRAGSRRDPRLDACLLLCLLPAPRHQRPAVQGGPLAVAGGADRLLHRSAALAARAALAPAPRPAAVETGQRPQLWVIGVDSATLDAILPLADQGRLPFLASVVQNGAHGRLESLSPARRDALWTTLATGKYPFKHGVTGQRPYPAEFLAPGGRLRLLPMGLSFRRWGTLGQAPLPAPSHPRQTLALWEILPRLGVPAGVVGWPAAEPADGEAVFALADRFFQAAPEAGSAWPAGLS